MRLDEIILVSTPVVSAIDDLVDVAETGSGLTMNQRQALKAAAMIISELDTVSRWSTNESNRNSAIRILQHGKLTNS